MQSITVQCCCLHGDGLLTFDCIAFGTVKPYRGLVSVGYWGQYIRLNLDITKLEKLALYFVILKACDVEIPFPTWKETSEMCSGCGACNVKCFNSGESGRSPFLHFFRHQQSCCTLFVGPQGLGGLLVLLCAREAPEYINHVDRFMSGLNATMLCHSHKNTERGTSKRTLQQHSQNCVRSKRCVCDFQPCTVALRSFLGAHVGA